MNTRKIWSVLAALLAGVLLAAPFVAAQDGLETTDADAGADVETELEDDDILDADRGRLGRDRFGDAGAFGTTGFDACGVDTGLGSVSDIQSSASQSLRRSQEVSVDEDDVLLSIALANNGASDITFADVRDLSVTEEVRASRAHAAELEREDVFSALALGVDADAGSLETLFCVGNMESEVTATRTIDRSVELDEDDVLLAIAINNAIGGGLAFEDVASIDIAVETELERDSTSDIDRDEAFLALALGAGGSDGFGGFR